jgi:hypothetical protein
MFGNLYPRAQLASWDLKEMKIQLARVSVDACISAVCQYDLPACASLVTGENLDTK